MTPSITIIILNWNGWKDTIECLESIFQIEYPNFQVLIVDNASKDQSIKKISEYCKGQIKVESEFFKYKVSNKPINVLELSKKRLKNFENEKIFESKNQIVLIKNDKNYGFAEGNNIGIKFTCKYLSSKYILLLNNDTVVSKDFLTKLILEAEENPSIGVLGPKIYYYADKSRIQSNGASINFWLGRSYQLDANKFEYNKSDENIKDVDFVLGAALMFRSKLIEEVGLLYSPYFAYWEETDWCTRVKNHGYRIVNVPSSKVWHKVSSSLSDYNPFRIFLILRNNILFMRRNSKKRYLLSFFVFYLIFRIPSLIVGNSYYNSNKNSLKLIKVTIKAIKEGLTININ